MKETLSASRWNELADRLGIEKPLVAFRWLEAHYEERARKYRAAGTPKSLALYFEHYAEALARRQD